MAGGSRLTPFFETIRELGLHKRAAWRHYSHIVGDVFNFSGIMNTIDAYQGRIGSVFIDSKYANLALYGNPFKYYVDVDKDIPNLAYQWRHWSKRGKMHADLVDITEEILRLRGVKVERKKTSRDVKYTLCDAPWGPFVLICEMQNCRPVEYCDARKILDVREDIILENPAVRAWVRERAERRRTVQLSFRSAQHYETGDGPDDDFVPSDLPVVIACPRLGRSLRSARNVFHLRLEEECPPDSGEFVPIDYVPDYRSEDMERLGYFHPIGDEFHLYQVVENGIRRLIFFVHQVLFNSSKKALRLAENLWRVHKKVDKPRLARLSEKLALLYRLRAEQEPWNVYLDIDDSYVYWVRRGDIHLVRYTGKPPPA